MTIIGHLRFSVKTRPSIPNNLCKFVRSIFGNHRSCVIDIINIKSPKSMKLIRMKNIKKGVPKNSSIYFLSFNSTNCRCSESNRSAISSSKVKWEVVSVALVHHFHTQTTTIQNICPSINYMTLAILD